MILGVTGSIGSGKSFVCDVFAHLGIPVYNSDMRGRELLATDIEIRDSVIKLLGPKAYPDNVPDRKYIASVVFENAELLQRLNEIIHPAVGKDFDQWLESHETADYCIKEAAILIESGAYKQTDRLLVVTAPKELRIKRVLQRDNTDRQAVLSRMNNQMSDDERKAYAHYIISNDENEMILPQILRVHEDLLS